MWVWPYGALTTCGMEVVPRNNRSFAVWRKRCAVDPFTRTSFRFNENCTCLEHGGRVRKRKVVPRIIRKYSQGSMHQHVDKS